MTNSAATRQNPDYPLRAFSVGDENIIIEAMVPTERTGVYAYLSFNASMIQQIASFEEKNAQMILHNGLAIPVAINPRELQTKVSTVDFKTGNKIDLTSVTGEAVKMTWPENMKPGQKIEDGSIYVGFHDNLDWYATDKDAFGADGKRLSLSFKEAAEYVQNLDAHGHRDWQIPTATVLIEMQKIRNKGNLYASFLVCEEVYDQARYLSSTRPSGSYMQLINFSSGACSNDYASAKTFLRPVRPVPRP